MDSSTGLVVTAMVAIIGIVKLKLIEELIKKITPDDGKSKGYAILLLSVIVIGLTIVSLSLDGPTSENLKVGTEEVVAQPTTPKSDLEVKVEAVKEGVALTEDIVNAAKENKRVKDSTFLAGRQERWVYRIGDWTKDDDDVIAMNSQLLERQNIKLIKQHRKYMFIQEDYKSKEELQKSLYDLKNELNGLAVDIIDLNTFLTRRKNNFLQQSETFGRRKNKITLECLVAD
jgi:hypothetical protein